MEFSTRIPVPEIGNGIFHSHSRSRNLGMEYAVPVPEVQKSFPLTSEEGGKEANLSGESQLALVEGAGLVLHILFVIIQTSPDRLRGTVTWSFTPLLDILGTGYLTKM